MPFLPSRRSFLTGLLVTAPAVIAYDKLMPVKLFVPSVVAAPTIEVLSDISLTGPITGLDTPGSIQQNLAYVDEWGYSKNPILHTKILIEQVKEAIGTTTESLMFEPNDTLTRTVFSKNVGAYLNSLRVSNKLIDYRIVADETNNTCEVIEKNEFKASVFVKPALSTDYVRIDSLSSSRGMSFIPVSVASCHTRSSI